MPFRTAFRHLEPKARGLNPFPSVIGADRARRPWKQLGWAASAVLPAHEPAYSSIRVPERPQLPDGEWRVSASRST